MTAAFSIRPVTAANFDDLARLFEARGGPAFCWCRVWRAALPGMNDGRAAERRAIRKAGLHAEVAAGTPVGLLAYAGGEPAGWLSCGPRDSFARLGRTPSAAGPVWSIVCFYVPASRRRQGIAAALLQAGIAAGRAAGAALVEAYPVDPDSPSFRFMGFVPQFERRGFADLGPLGKRRHVMRLMLQDT